LKRNEIPPYSIILTVIAFINIFFSTYFITLLLVGVVFKIFLESLKLTNYYLLIYVILIFIIIEAVQGFKIFSLTFISLGLYYFIIPRIKHLFSSSIVAEVMFILTFYIALFIYVSTYTPFNIEVLWIFLYNFIIDSLIVSFII